MNAPKYWPKVIALAKELGLDPGVVEVDVLHDDWCNVMTGAGQCNCDPDVAIRDTHRGKKN